MASTLCSPYTCESHARKLVNVCSSSTRSLGSSGSRGTLHVTLPALRHTDGEDSTGSAGLIQTIQMYTRPAFVAAALGTVATVGWVIQGVGNALYYRQVKPVVDNSAPCHCSLLARFGHTTRARVTQSKRCVCCPHHRQSRY